MEDWKKSLIEKIHNTDDKALFEEAIGCYSSKYYRASYVMTWVSIVESLKSKIYEYANLENKVARMSVIEIEKLEKDKKSVDVKIIDEAKKCEIIDENEYQIIEFIWRQRCVFAHPYQKLPSEEEIRLALYKAVEIVLSKELIYSKPLIEELIENIVNKPHFLPNDLASVREIAIQNIKRIPRRLYPFFFKSLLFKVGEYENDHSKALILNKLRVYLVNFIKVVDIDLNSIEFGLEYRAINFPYSSLIGYIDAYSWVKISERIKTIIFDYIPTINELNKKNIVRNIICKLISSNVLEEKYKNVYTNLLNKDGFLQSINFYGDIENVYIRIKTELLTGNFTQQNIVIDFLSSKSGLENVAKFKDSTQQSLGRLVYYCAEEGNWKSQSFIDTIFDNSPMYPPWLKQGVCLGIFIDKYNRLSINYSLLESAAKVIGSIDANATHELFDLIYNTIDREEKEGQRIYLAHDKLLLLRNELLRLDAVSTNKLGKYFERFFEKLESLLGDESDLPF